MKRHAIFLIGAWAPMILGADSGQPLATASDRVGFPSGYQERFQVLRTVIKEEELRVATVYGNDRAASVTTVEQLPYPFGSIMVMEWRAPLKDPAGRPILDADGNLQKGDVVRLDVMRREKDFGQAYGNDRTAEWEYASYRPDGGYVTAPADSVSCARCHVRAGAARDFVFHGRFPDAAKR